MLEDRAADRGHGGSRRKKLTDEPLRVFLFRLALEMQEVDPDAMAARMPLPLLWEWLAYYQREPFGDEWRRTGRLAALVVAAAGAKIEGEMEELFMPGNGKYRGMNQSEVAMLEELRKIPQFRERIDRSR
jgi:hypothetical protein